MEKRLRERERESARTNKILTHQEDFLSPDPSDTLTRGHRSRPTIVMIDYHHYRKVELKRLGNISKSL